MDGFHLDGVSACEQVNWAFRQTKTIRFRIFAVIAWLTSVSLGGSTKSAVFSSAGSRLSVPFFVTHGCSYEKFSLRSSQIGCIRLSIPVVLASLFSSLDLSPEAFASSPQILAHYLAQNLRRHS